MQREEPAQRGAADDRPAQHAMNRLRTHPRHSPRHRAADRQTPISVGIPPHHLAGEKHSQRAEQEKHADDPSEFARIFVRPMQKDLRHVNQHQHDHPGACVIMQRPQKPTERLLVVQIEQALIRSIRRRNVNQSQPDAGQDLHHQQGERSAAEDIPPAERPRDLFGNRMGQHRHQRGAHVEPLVEPSADCREPAFHLRPLGTSNSKLGLPPNRLTRSHRRRWIARCAAVAVGSGLNELWWGCRMALGRSF